MYFLYICIFTWFKSSWRLLTHVLIGLMISI